MHRLFITALACMMITQVFSQRLLIKTNPFTPFMGKYNISNEIGLNHNYSFNLNSSFIYDNDLITWTQNQWGFNENNQWGLSTPSKEQFNCKQFIDKGIGYGMKTKQVDGNK